MTAVTATKHLTTRVSPQDIRDWARQQEAEIPKAVGLVAQRQAALVQLDRHGPRDPSEFGRRRDAIRDQYLGALDALQARAIDLERSARQALAGYRPALRRLVAALGDPERSAAITTRLRRADESEVRQVAAAAVAHGDDLLLDGIAGLMGGPSEGERPGDLGLLRLLDQVDLVAHREATAATVRVVVATQIVGEIVDATRRAGVGHFDLAGMHLLQSANMARDADAVMVVRVGAPDDREVHSRAEAEQFARAFPGEWVEVAFPEVPTIPLPNAAGTGRA